MDLRSSHKRKECSPRSLRSHPGTFCRQVLGFLLLVVYFSPYRAGAQTEPRAEENVVGIEDNSFFVEEAYNQVERVVQHILGTVIYRRPLPVTASTFTQEWPLWGVANQFSYTIAYAFLGSPFVNGFGDMLVNYRYQLLPHDAWVSCAPRLSIILPTGSVEKGLGMGGAGWQLNIPFSKMLAERLVVHWNLGMTYFPRARGADPSGQTVHRELSWYNLAASAIWLAHHDWNLMLEWAFNSTAEINESGEVSRSTEHIISPGIRWAINFENLQIVPGIAIPISILDGEARTGLFLYLSFEHPF